MRIQRLVDVAHRQRLRNGPDPLHPAEVMVGNALSFDEFLKTCAKLEAEVNNYVVAIGNDNQNPSSQPFR